MSSDLGYHFSDVTAEFSVLMSVYSESSPEYLNEAMRSIWDNQTLKPAQICLVCDGKLPTVLEEVLAIWSERLGSFLTLVRLKNHGGLALALNKGIAHCKFPLIARMDADDVSLPNRFFLQYHYMSDHPEVDALGAQVEEWNDDLTHFINFRKAPKERERIIKFAKLRSPINHPTVMCRKTSLERVGLYPLMYPEDYPLWCTMLQKGCVLDNLSETLVLMRSSSAYSFRRGNKLFKAECEVLAHLHKIGFLSTTEYMLSIFVRFFYRNSPTRIKILLKSLASYFQ